MPSGSRPSRSTTSRPSSRPSGPRTSGSRRRWRISGRLLLAGALAGWLTAGAADGRAAEWLADQGPEFLTFEELRALCLNPYPMGPAREKLERLWATPIVSNHAAEAGVVPHAPSNPFLGKFLRVVTWNIEQSRRLDAAVEAFTDREAFAARLDPGRAAPGSRRLAQALAERALLAAADVVVLQEMEIGIKRSGYRDAAQELARALQMNYAYLPQYLEVDPVALGIERIAFQEGPDDPEATAYYAVDPARYRGVFGTAVLSRYPIVRVEGFRLFTRGYDWYWQERLKPTYLERLRRTGARAVFREQVHREIKVGGRTYFRVDLAVPQVPGGRVSIVNVHLEIKCEPAARARQMAEILNYIKNIRHPVILAGDFNSAPQDLSPTSTPRVLTRGVSSPEFWFSRGLEYLLPQALVLNVAKFLANVTKNYQDPTAMHIPLLAPNETGELFSLLQRFRFADGGAFDFRGTRGRTAGRTGKLGNSNERDAWGYRVTFRVARPVAKLIGKYRLDWIFVKAYARAPFDRRGSYRFAPHFGRTLNSLNRSLRTPISDHDPCLVDLPFAEPADPRDHRETVRALRRSRFGRGQPPHPGVSHGPDRG